MLMIDLGAGELRPVAEEDVALDDNINVVSASQSIDVVVVVDDTHDGVVPDVGRCEGDVVDIGNLGNDSRDDKEVIKSANTFELLVEAIEGQEGLVLSPKKSRLAAGGVANLMNQLKPKQKGPKKKNGKGSKQKQGGAISSDLVKHFSSSLGVVDTNVIGVSDGLLRDILGVELSAEMKNSLVAPVTQ
ncbi:hypothetical protein V6N13_108300 [Hibiscus sabdariffa]